MSSELFSHGPARPFLRSQPGAALMERPVVVLTYVKHVLIIVAGLGIFTSLWLNLLSELASEEHWYALRLLAFGGAAGIVTLVVLGVKFSTFLFKHLARPPTRN